MISKFWIVFNRQTVDRLHKSDKFQLARGEKCVKVTFEAPDSLFMPPPQLSARLEVSDAHAGSDAQIVLDPNEWPNPQRGDHGQQMLNKMAAQLIERAVNSTDPSDRKFGLDALTMCRESGIDVRINVPEEEVPA